MNQAQQISTTGGRGAPCGIPTGIDWAKADYQTEAGRKALAAALTDYFRDLGKEAPAGLMLGGKTTRPGHLPGALPSLPDIDVRFHSVMDDSGVLSLFRYVDKRSSKNPVFQFANVNAGSIVFEQKEPGKPARIRKVEGGTPVPVSSVTWQGAIGIDDDAQRFDDYGIFEQNVQAVPSIWLNTLASSHAALFTALGSGVNETWATDLVTTLNNASAKIIEDVGDTYGLDDNPSFGLLYNHRDAAAVAKALFSAFGVPNDNNSATQLMYDIRPVKTRKVAAGSMYVALPGQDLVTVEWDELAAEYGRDWARGTDAFIYTARRNAAIGNVGQVRRITLQ